MRQRWWLLMASGVMLAASACGGPRAADVAPADAPPVRVEVRNKYGLPMDVYAQGGGSNQLLGTVYPGAVKAFVIPQPIANSGSVELQAHPSAMWREVARSGPLILSPGAVVDFVIAAQLFASTATIRP